MTMEEPGPNTDSLGDVSPPPVLSPNVAEREPREALLCSYLARFSEKCPVCGYDLHNLRAARCPECGEELYLCIVAEHPRQGEFIAGLVALAGATGFGALMAALLFVFIVLMSQAPVDLFDEERRMFIFLGIAVISGGLTLGWIRLGRWLHRRPIQQRLILCIACYGYVAALFFVAIALRAW